MKETGRYLNLLFGKFYDKSLKISDLISKRCCGFEKKTIYNNLSKLSGVVVNDDTMVKSLF